MRAQNCLFSEETIEENLKSRKSLVLFRTTLLEGEESGCDENEANGFASLFLPLLSESIDDFRTLLNTPPRSDSGSGSVFLLSERNETKRLKRVLNIYRKISELDPTLDEEIGNQGAHRYLSRIIRLDISSVDCCSTDKDNDSDEANQDTIIEIQDLACEIASFSKSFPLPASPFIHQDLVARLPLTFNVCPEQNYRTDSNGITILINQVKDRQSAQKDVGFVMWPSAVVLSRWLVSNPEEIIGKTVLELGSGCGLTGLVAARILNDANSKSRERVSSSTAIPTGTLEEETTHCNGSGRVILSDFNSTVVKNLEGNINLNNLQSVATAEGLDFYQQDPNENGWLTVDGKKQTDLADVVLAADVICEPEDAFALARTIACSLREGAKAFIVSADSKHRFGVEKLEEACDILGSLSVLSKVSVDDFVSKHKSSSKKESGDDDDDMEKTSGFVRGMKLTMYTIVKNSRHG